MPSFLFGLGRYASQMFGKSCRRRPGTFRPGLEVLEERLLLDTYLWTNAAPEAGDKEKWSIRANWLVNDVIPGRQPAAGDTLKFTNASVSNSTNDIAGLTSITRIEVNANYTGTISLGSNPFTISDGFLRGGTVQATSITVAAVPLEWSGGIIDGNMAVAPGKQLTVNPATNTFVTFRNGYLTNSGTISHSSGMFGLVNATLYNEGTIAFEGSAQRVITPVSRAGQLATSVQNATSGVIEVNVANFSMQSPFVNNGTTNIANNSRLQLAGGGDLNYNISLGQGGTLDLNVINNLSDQTALSEKSYEVGSLGKLR